MYPFDLSQFIGGSPQLVAQEQPMTEMDTAQQILSSRFEPTANDIGNAAVQGVMTDSYVNPQAFSDARVQGAMKNLLAATEMQKNAAQAKLYSMGGSGNATISAARALMAENPDLSFADAFSIAKSGLGVGQTYVSGQGVRPIAGAPEAAGQMRAGEKAGEQRTVLAYSGPIAANTEIGKYQGEKAAQTMKQQAQAQDMLFLIQQAETTLPKATSGGLQAGYAMGKGLAGVSDDMTQADRQLKVLSAALTSNVPRFEGPQGVIDVEIYKQAAADVGNSAVPWKDRMAALQTVKAMQARNLAKTPQIPAVPGAPTQAAPAGAPRAVVRTQISPSTGMRKVTYSDGTEEIIPASPASSGGGM